MNVTLSRIESATAWRKALVRVAALTLAFMTGALFIRIIGMSPIAVYQSMIKGVVGTNTAIRETIKIAVPLCVCSLGLSLAFLMKFWNIGGEGQISAGAIAATWLALFHADLPSYILLPLMFVFAAIAGALLAFIPAYFKTKYGTNETLFTLMLNYVMVYVIQGLREGAWKNPRDMGYPKIAMFDLRAQLPRVLGVNAGWIIALALLIVLFVYVRHTKQGYELTVVGANPNTARYAGMPVSRIVIRTAMISGAICAVAGFIKVSGSDKTLTDTVAGGIGFSSITVAWLANLQPIGILFVSVLLGALEKGAGYAQSTFKISSAAAQVLQGIILFFVLGGEFFLRYRVKVCVRRAASSGR